MSDLLRINNYIKRLKKVTSDLRILSDKLQDKKTSVDEYEELYGREFFLSMQLADIHETIHLLIDGLEADALTKRRLRKETDSVFTPLVIEVKNAP